MGNLGSNARGNNGGRFYSFLNQPSEIDCLFTVAASDSGGLGITGLKGSGVNAVYMNTSATPATGNPNPAAGYVLVQLKNNYSRLGALSWSFRSPATGSTSVINSTALTPGAGYQIATVGVGPTGAFTVAPVADVSGSLASTYFICFDQYGNTFCIWNYVTGVGGAPPALGAGVTYVQQTVAENITAANYGTALVATLALVTGPGNPAGVYSYTATGTTTVTVTGTATGVQFPGGPYDGTSPLNTGFTFALTKYGSNTNAWQQVGLFSGLTPTVNQAFIATASGYSTGGGSTGTVRSTSAQQSGLFSVEVAGDPNVMVSPSPVGQSPNIGGWLLLKLLGPTSTSNPTPVLSAPTVGTIIQLQFLMEISSTRISGT